MIQMATLQKLKLLATQCGASPTHSPAGSPIFLRRRRRRTLRMLLSGHRENPTTNKTAPAATVSVTRLKLKDFLLSSPPERSPEKRVSVPRGSRRPFTATLRQRLLRKTFRPVLGTIPE